MFTAAIQFYLLLKDNLPLFCWHVFYQCISGVNAHRSIGESLVLPLESASEFLTLIVYPHGDVALSNTSYSAFVQ